MANWSNPLLTSTYTNFLTEVKDRDTDLALQFDGTTSSNIPTNAIRWNSSVNRWQKWNGSSWAELTSTYALTGLSTTGNATIGGTLGSGAITSTGSVSGTALIPTGNTVPATGVYLPSTNVFGVATSSTARIIVDASGNVGIGTLSPVVGLHIAQAAASATTGNFLVAPPAAGQARMRLYNQGGQAEWIFGQKTGTDHSFKLSKSVAGSESDYLTVDTTGRVGIGTSSPNSRLHLSDGELTISTGGNVTDAGGTINFGIAALPSSSPMATVQGLLVNATGTELQGGLGFFTRPNGTAGQSLQRRMTITSDGSIGINTTAPYSRFTVVPSSTPSTPATANQITVGESSGNGAYRLQLGYLYDTLGRGSIQAYDNGNPSPLILNGAGGNVGIGTSAPVYSLDVNGRIRGVGSSAALIASNGSGTSQTSISLIREGAATNQKTWELLTLSGGDFKIRTISDDYTASQDAIVVNRGSGFSVDNVQLHANGSERLRIDSSGRVGIGTTAPGTSFDVALAAPSATIGNIRISPSSPGQARYHLYNGGATAEWVFGQATSTSHDFTFSKSVGGSESEYLRIGTSGQIGIGGANYGTSGQVLTSNGSGSSPSWTTVAALTAGTAVSATGTAVDFTGIPSSVKRITVMIDAVSTDASATLAVQLGDSGGIETSGYTGGLAWTGPSTGSSGSASTFPLAIGAASDTVSGHAVITKVSGNTWVLSSTVARDNDDLVFISGGSKGLSATLDRIRITTTGGSASFDGGTVNILYE
jgi:hypothetical protein